MAEGSSKYVINHLQQHLDSKSSPLVSSSLPVLFTLPGDSLQYTFATTLAFILRADSIVKNSVKDVWSACEGKLNFTFMRNDYLDTRPSAGITDKCDDTTRNMAKMTGCAIFASDETLGEVDILVVNSGAHMTAESVYGPAMRAVSESLTASMTRLHGNESILIARNTVPGHWNCTER